MKMWETGEEETAEEEEEGFYSERITLSGIER